MSHYFFILLLKCNLEFRNSKWGSLTTNLERKYRSLGRLFRPSPIILYLWCPRGPVLKPELLNPQCPRISPPTSDVHINTGWSFAIPKNLQGCIITCNVGLPALRSAFFFFFFLPLKVKESLSLTANEFRALYKTSRLENFKAWRTWH